MFNTNFAAPVLPLIRDAGAFGFLEIFSVWSGRIRSRRALAKLDPHQQRDIGWTAQEIHQEATKPFWRA